MSILITGGTGYIGSHTILDLLDSGYSVIAMDNLANSKKEAVSRIEKLTGKSCPFENVDLMDRDGLRKLFDQYDIEGVIHFAGLKAVGESVDKPLLYYQNNVAGTLNLLEVMQNANVKKMVFSSSCTVYGDPEKIPVDENAPLSATNPYGRTKLVIEEILGDLYKADNEWTITLLRYFNPAGAHESGDMGEDPLGIPNNLVPYVAKVAAGKLEQLTVFGDDYPTKDGTGVRDYIHVMDLAAGHLSAWADMQVNSGMAIYNLGTGTGYSVLDIISAFEKASGKKVPYRIADRRPGDIAASFADPSKAEKKLGWKAKRGLQQMCRDVWSWQVRNPDGYR